MLLKIGQARLINFIGIPYKCKALHRCFFLGIWKHLPKWKFLSSNEGDLPHTEGISKYQGKKTLEDASLQKTLACHKLGCPTGLLETSRLTPEGHLKFFGLLSPPATTLGLQASNLRRLWGAWLPLYLSHWKLFEIKVNVEYKGGTLRWELEGGR